MRGSISACSPQPLVLHQFPPHPRGAGFLRAQGFEVGGEVFADLDNPLAAGHVGVGIRDVESEMGLLEPRLHAQVEVRGALRRDASLSFGFTM